MTSSSVELAPVPPMPHREILTPPPTGLHGGQRADFKRIFGVKIINSYPVYPGSGPRAQQCEKKRSLFNSGFVEIQTSRQDTSRSTDWKCSCSISFKSPQKTGLRHVFPFYSGNSWYSGHFPGFRNKERVVHKVMRDQCTWNERIWREAHMDWGRS